MMPLFERFPVLAQRLPWTPLATLPTPLEEASRLLEGAPVAAFSVKQDGVSGAPYGGNKVRKLEFLLGHALREGARTVLTFGAAGSNHALATAVYARKLGLNSVSMLVPQPPARTVQRNLLYGHLQGAELNYYLGKSRVALGTLGQFVRRKCLEGRFPQVIPPGGSSPLGCCGFINAALELHQQVRDTGASPPEVVYVASGTMGSAVGLLLGLRLAGLNTVVQAIRVTSPPYTSPEKARALYEATQRYLHALDPSFPSAPFPEEQFVLRDEFLGEKYGVYTPEGLEAIQRAREHAGLRLEGTYTGKALAALLADARNGLLADKHVVFWNTYNAVDFSEAIAGQDYHALPGDFHAYFEGSLQDSEELDRDGNCGRLFDQAPRTKTLDFLCIIC